MEKEEKEMVKVKAHAYEVAKHLDLNHIVSCPHPG
jgi:hypothetical protein